MRSAKLPIASATRPVTDATPGTPFATSVGRSTGSALGTLPVSVTAPLFAQTVTLVARSPWLFALLSARRTSRASRRLAVLNSAAVGDEAATARDTALELADCGCACAMHREGAILTRPADYFIRCIRNAASM